MSKYFIGKIHERNGEHEYSTPILFEFGDKDNLKSMLDVAVSTWYGQSSKVGNGYEFFHGGVFVSMGNCKEISKQVFDEISEFVVQL